MPEGILAGPSSKIKSMTLIMLGMHGSRVLVLIILAVILSTAEEYMRSIDCLKEISGIVEKLLLLLSR